MKTFTFKLFVVLLFTSVTACDRSVVVEEVHTFPQAVWNRFNILQYSMRISDLRSEYDLIVQVNIIDDRVPERFPIHFILTSPSEEKRIWEQTLLFRNPDNSLRGNQNRGVHEIEFVVRNRMKFNERGPHILTLEQFHHLYNTHGIVSVGVRLIKK